MPACCQASLTSKGSHKTVFKFLEPEFCAFVNTETQRSMHENGEVMQWTIFPLHGFINIRNAGNIFFQEGYYAEM